MNCEQYFTVTDSKIKDNIVIIFYLSVSGFFTYESRINNFVIFFKVKSLLIIQRNDSQQLDKLTLSNSFEL